MTISRTEAHDEQIGILHITVHFEIRYLNISYLLLAQTCHQVMVLRIGGDSTRFGILLQSAKNMLESFTPRNSPIAGSILGAHIRCPLSLQFLRNIRRIDGIHLGEIRKFEGA